MNNSPAVNVYQTCFFLLRLIFLPILVLLSGCSLINEESIGDAPQQKKHFVSLEEATRNMEENYSPGHLWRMRLGHKKYPKDPEKAWEWFVQRRRSRDGIVPISYRENALAFSKKNCRPTGKFADVPWNYVGPVTSGSVQPSGRLIDLAVHPNGQTIYAASASGGVRKTTDQGLNWTNCTDFQLPSLGCGSIAMDPNNPDVLYLGMGEGMSGTGTGVEPLGTGIYKTTDGGQTWNLLNGTGSGTMQFIVDLRFAGNSNTLFAAATGGANKAGSGLWKTIDGGNNWTEIVSGIPVWSVSVDPVNANNVVVSTREDDANGFHCHIYYATDGVQNTNSFTEAAFPFNGEYDQNIGPSYRIELTRCAQSPNTLYAMVGSQRSLIHGIWKSTNGGVNWTATAGTGIPTAGDYQPKQMTYNNCIAVAPNNPNKVVFGSNLRPYQSTDGAGSWSAIADWAAADSLPYLHADHHAIVFNSADSNTIYLGTDGGFFISTDGGTTWQERNNGIQCTQIYRIANHPTNEQALAFGCQDNDKYLRKPDGSWFHYPNTFGDGMEMECITLDPESDGYLGQGYYGLNMKFTDNGGSNWYPLRFYQNDNNGIPDDEKGAWVSPLMFDPQHQENIWVCLKHVYRRVYDPDTIQNWTRIIELPATQHVDTWEFMQLSSGAANRQIYIGYARYNAENQLITGLYRADIGDGTGGAAGLTELALPRDGYIGALKCDPTSNDTVWMTFSDFFKDTGANPRIYKSLNKGQTWEDKTNNFPQDLPVTAIFIDPDNTSNIILGTDLGCYRSDDGGATWEEYNNSSLPNTVVTDFAYYPPGRLLRCGTYGRGLWEIQLDGVAGEPEIAIAPEILTFTKNIPDRPFPATKNNLTTSAKKVATHGIVTILNEDFETGPFDHWIIEHNPQTFDVDWGIDDYYYHSGSQSAFCARTGQFGVDPEVDYCPDGIDSYMAYGPFDLSDASAAQLTFWAWWDILEANGDLFRLGVGLDEDFNQSGWYEVSGYSNGWQQVTVDFSQVQGLGNVLGRSQVWILFEAFRNVDFIGYSLEGIWVDDVVITKTVADVLAAPTGVNATTNKTDRVTVSWNAVAGADQYQVWRNIGTDNPGAATALSGWIAALTHDDMTAQPGTTYYYYVKAKNPTTESPLSTGAAGSLAAGPPLDPPTGVSATTDLTDRVTINWNTVTDATEYQVWRNTGTDNAGAATALSGWIAALTYDDTTAQEETTYFYYAMARNAISISPLSTGAQGSLASKSTLDPQIFTISNPGKAALKITDIVIKNASPWLVISPNTFPMTIPAGSTANISVKVLDVGMANGEYSDQLIISNNSVTKNPYPTGVNVLFFNGVTPITSVSVRSHLVGASSLPDAARNSADRNADGVVDVSDLIKLVIEGK